MARKLQADEWLFAATIGLVLFGLVMVYSASAPLAAHENSGPYFYVLRQGLWTLLGIGGMLVAMRIDYHKLVEPRIVFSLLTLTVLLLLAVFMFPKVNGAHRWIKFGGFSLQPSELSKISLVLFMAWFLNRAHSKESSFWLTFLPCMMVTGLLAGLVVLEPDLGTALMLVTCFLAVSYAAGISNRFLLIAAAPIFIGVLGLLIFVPWRMQRLITFLDPWKDPLNSGYQIVQSLVAVGSGGVNGLGFADGRQKMLFLPFAHSDFIFAVISEELGLIGGLALIAVFALFLWRGVVVAMNAADRVGMLLGFGIVAPIVVQALFNISVVLSLVPTKGIPLPFISYGGSSLVFTLFSVGILLNISEKARLGHYTANRFNRLVDVARSYSSQQKWRSEAHN
jgi:cell division protein FtsW